MLSIGLLLPDSGSLSWCPGVHPLPLQTRPLRVNHPELARFSEAYSAAAIRIARHTPCLRPQRERNGCLPHPTRKVQKHTFPHRGSVQSVPQYQSHHRKLVLLTSHVCCSNRPLRGSLSDRAIFSMKKIGRAHV